jgi:signal transduction histidine kinase
MATITKTDRLAKTPAEKIWHILTAPHPTITDASERRKAHITSALLLASAVSLAFQLIISPTLPALIPVILAFVSYGVSRTRSIGASVFINAFAFTLSVFWQMAQVQDWSTSNALSYLGWLIVPVVLSGLLLTPRATLLIVITIAMGMFVLRALVFTNIPNVSFGVAVGFVMTLSAIITLATYLQEYYFVRPRLEEIKKAQLELEAKNRALELANAEIKDFSYMIAHDLRAPVVNITEYLQEIRYSLDTVKPAIEAGLSALTIGERPIIQAAMQDDLPESLEVVESSVKRMTSLINEILRLARAGQRDIDEEALNPRTIVQSVVVRYAHALPAEAVKIGALPDEIVADRVIFEEVLSNLIDNATKYTLLERPLRIEINGEAHAEEIIFHIKDNGRGIPTTEEANVFMPFRRASNTVDVKGTGVGLYYVRALLERRGGRIWFTSQPEAGTTFSFSIAKTNK